MPSGVLCITIADLMVMNRDPHAYFMNIAGGWWESNLPVGNGDAHAYVIYITGGQREDGWQSLLINVWSSTQMTI